MGGKNWSDKDIELLKNNLDKTNDELAKLLGRSKTSIICYKKKHNLYMKVTKYKDQPGEIFKKINEYNGKYAISNFGTLINESTHVKISTRYENGYERANVYYTESEKEIHKNVRIHILVAKYFLNNKKETDIEVNHIDGDKSNNKVTNLEWCTKPENMDHAIETGLFKPQYNNNSITEDKVREICEYLTNCKTNQTVGDVAKYFDLSYDIVRGIYYRRSWTNITKDYKFVILKGVTKNINDGI